MDPFQGVRSFPDDCLPPECNYESRDSLAKAINAWAAPRGYAFVTGRSTREKTGRLTVTFTCDRFRRPPNTSREGTRKTCTRSTSCQFSILAKQSVDGTWAVRHRRGQHFAVHNHEPSQHRSAHPVHRALSGTDKSTIKNLTNAGVAPRDIRTYLRQSSNSVATQQDIYNYIAECRRDIRQGQSSIHALVNQLDDQDFWSRTRVDTEGRVTAIFFAHVNSLAYLQAYPDLLILDCTYKTNKYGMPLLNIIGVDACQHSFCIAFAFLSGETEPDYLWALGRLKSLYEVGNTRLPSVILTDRDRACMNAAASLFPSTISLLCRWHANKAVLSHCQSAFVRGSPGSEEHQQGVVSWNEFFSHWHLIMASPDEENFNQRVQEFEKQYLPQHVEEVSYIKNWLDLYKEKLVKAWVDQHPHFGNVVTSRVEGIHAMLKTHLQTSKSDLFEAWQAIKNAVYNQLAELRANQAIEQIQTPLELSKSLYGAVFGWISREALRMVEEQRKRLSKGNLPPCTSSFTRSQGLPCAHVLKDLQERNQALRLEDFHAHWHLHRDDTYQFLLEPCHRHDRISTRPPSSTRREPSTFEAVEAAAKPRAPSTCSRCHQLGHTMASKACPLRHKELLESAASIQRPADHGVTGQTAALRALASNTSTSQRPAVREMADQTAAAQESAACIVVDQSVAVHTAAGQTVVVQAVAEHTYADQTVAVQAAVVQTASAAIMTAPELRYNDPQAIYQRYVAAREAWYRAQPRGSIRTNQQYRTAMSLPQRYDKASYKWCLDYKQMGQRCITSTGIRDWTKEEMIAYLDWSKVEDDRVEAQVAAEMAGNPFSSRRGMGEIWDAAARDVDEQQALWEARNIEE